MKKFILILAGICLAAVLFACGSSRSGRKTEQGDHEAGQKTEIKNSGTTENDRKAEAGSSVSGEAEGEVDSMEENSSHILVAYFSATGTTRRLAEYVADITGADLYEIVPKEPYTDADLDWNDKKSRTTIEMNDASSRPAISGSVSDMGQYDTVFLAYAGGIIGLN